METAARWGCSLVARGSGSFNVDDPVWLSIPTAEKWDPCLDGKWRIHAIPGPVTYVIHDGPRYKTVHVNRLWRHIQPDLESTPIQTDSDQNNSGASHHYRRSCQ